MTNYTAQELEQAIEGHDDFDGWHEIKWEADGQVALTVTLGEETVEIIKVEDFGGEGQGDNYWVVIQAGTQYFQKDGYYSSAYGGEFDGDLDEVKPVEKTVTVYEAL